MSIIKAIAICVAWVVAFVGYNGVKDLLQWLRKHKNRPRLVISIQNPTFTEATVEEQGTVRFYHLRVLNMGRTNAADCRVRVLAVWKEANQDNILGTGAVPLHWAHQPLDVDTRDVCHGEFVELDLVTQAAASPSLLSLFGTTEKTDGLRKVYEPGSYILKLRVTADNHVATDLRVRIEHPGAWDKPPKLTQLKQSVTGD